MDVGDEVASPFFQLLGPGLISSLWYDFIFAGMVSRVLDDDPNASSSNFRVHIGLRKD